MKETINLNFVILLVALLAVLIGVYIYLENKPENTDVLDTIVVVDTPVLVEDTIVLETPPETVLEDDYNDEIMDWYEDDEEEVTTHPDTVISIEIHSGGVVYRPEFEHK